MKFTRRTLRIGAILIILLLILVTAGLVYFRRENTPANTPPAVGSGSPFPQTTPTASQNTGFLPLVSKPATATPTPTQTFTPTPTITPTPAPIILSFCDQAPSALPILDYSTITDTLPVDFPGILLDVDLELDIQHSYTGDLEVRLSIVDGPGITILDRPGPPPLYCDQDNIQAIFDDEASASASQVCNPSPALSGPLRPEQPLSTFDNLPATSRWQLVVTDRSSPDSGFLNGWCILATIR